METITRKRPNLSEICVYGGKQEDEFVGIRYLDGNLKVYFPYGYSKPADEEKEYRRDILNLVSVLSAYSRESQNVGKNLRLNEDEVQFPIHAYIHVFDYFLNFGYYVESEAIYKRASSGKINWSRTIKQIRPRIAGEYPNESVVYLDFITRKSCNDENEMITQIHKYCVYESYEKIGCLFGYVRPEKPTVVFNERLFVTLLRSKISKTFNERHLSLFQNMLDIIRYIGKRNDSKKAFFGTKDFEYVWEGLIDSVFGIEASEKKKYYPHCSWKIHGKKAEAEMRDEKRTALRPDTIMLLNDDIFILDAKYYQYGEDGTNRESPRNSQNLPGTGSIVKQIAYAEFIEARQKWQPEKYPQGKIFNAFVMPYASCRNSMERYALENVGYASCDWIDGEEEKSYDKIYGILLDVRALMYRHPKKSGSDIAALARKLDSPFHHLKLSLCKKQI